MQKFEDTATERDDLRTEVGQLRNDVRHAKQENAVLTDQVALYSGGASGIEHRDLYEARSIRLVMLMCVAYLAASRVVL